MDASQKEAVMLELRDLLAYSISMMQRLENCENRVGVIIESSRLQMGHLVGDLKIKEMYQELRHMNATLVRLEQQLA